MFAETFTSMIALADFCYGRSDGHKAPIRPAITPDPRFGRLLSAVDWAALPEAVRIRFGRKARGTATISYVGTVDTCTMSRTGCILAQLARVIGGPLPLSQDCDVPAVVTVTEDEATGGQFWVRQYGHHQGFPQVIHSVKRFAGPTGIEEYLGLGLGIALTLRVAAGVLLFESDHYFWQVAGMRLRLPRWLAPGHLVIGHEDWGAGRFAFTLDLTHPAMGKLITQRCTFRECTPQGGMQ